MNHLVNFGLLLGLMAILPMSPAYAYLDAGSVSMALQIAIGAVASTMVFAKFYLGRLMGLFKRRRVADKDTRDAG